MCLIHENPRPLLVLYIYVDGTQRVLVLLVLAILFQDCQIYINCCYGRCDLRHYIDTAYYVETR